MGKWRVVQEGWIDLFPEGLPCPRCGERLSIIPAYNLKDPEVLFVVTCEVCRKYNGFVIKTGLDLDDLKKFTKYHKETITEYVEIVGFREEDLHIEVEEDN